VEINILASLGICRMAGLWGQLWPWRGALL